MQRQRGSPHDAARTQRHPRDAHLHPHAAGLPEPGYLHRGADDRKLRQSSPHGPLPVMMDTLLLLALNGLIWGLIIALIALGLSVIFGLLDIINIAHGDFFMVGTVLAWAAFESTGNFWLGFIIVPVLCFVLGAAIQRVVIQPIRGAASLTIVATFGLSLILQEVVRMTFGATPRRMLPPIQGTIPVFGVE